MWDGIEFRRIPEPTDRDFRLECSLGMTKFPAYNCEQPPRLPSDMRTRTAQNGCVHFVIIKSVLEVCDCSLRGPDKVQGP